MKKFEDLKFSKHHNFGIGGFQERAYIEFENKYGVSVITGGYGSASEPYELAIMYEGDLCYSTDITDDVIGYLTPNKVSYFMNKVQKLK